MHPLLPKLHEYLDLLHKTEPEIPESRKKDLLTIAHYIHTTQKTQGKTNLNFICTHNSRRSHFAQIWTAIAAYQAGLNTLHTFSGGTETTALHPNAVAALRRAGFRISVLGLMGEADRSASGSGHPHVQAAMDEGDLGSEVEVANPANPANPRYALHYAPDHSPLICYSKRFDQSVPQGKPFAAIMTCSDADEHCPFVPGADFRQSLPFDDPKQADGTAREALEYDERCRQIASEMVWLVRAAIEIGT